MWGICYALMLYGLMIFHASFKGSGETLIKMWLQDLVVGHNFDIYFVPFLLWKHDRTWKYVSLYWTRKFSDSVCVRRLVYSVYLIISINMDANACVWCVGAPLSVNALWISMDFSSQATIAHLVLICSQIMDAACWLWYRQTAISQAMFRYAPYGSTCQRSIKICLFASDLLGYDFRCFRTIFDFAQSECLMKSFLFPS